MDDDEYSSELTSIDSSSPDTDYDDSSTKRTIQKSSTTKPAKTKQKKKSKTATHTVTGGSSYRIRNALKVPRATTYTAQALYDQISSSDIILDPEYQRDVVWPESKQIGVIDSVFRNFYIPPIIFAVKTHNDGSETKICIDGKQRLTSIHRFMDGRIPHKDAHTGEKLYFKPITSSSSSNPNTTTSKKQIQILPDKYKRLFANKQIVCVEYQDITDADEREVFQRVQLGMALTPAEKLQIISSPRAAFIRTLVTHHLKEEGPLGGSALEWDTTRGSDFRCVGQAIFYMEKLSCASSASGGGMAPKAAGITQLEKWLNLEGEFEKDFKKEVKYAFRVFKNLVVGGWLKGTGNSSIRRGNASGNNGGGGNGVPVKVSPIEFQMMAVMIFAWMERERRKVRGGGGSAKPKLKGNAKGNNSDMEVDQSSDSDDSDFDDEDDEDGEAKDDGVDKAALANAIQDMRNDVRKTHVDIRMNNRVGNHMLEFVKRVMDGNMNAEDGGDSSAVNAGAGSAGVGEKRKRVRSNKGSTAKSPPKKKGKAKKDTSSEDGEEEHDELESEEDGEISSGGGDANRKATTTTTAQAMSAMGGVSGGGGGRKTMNSVSSALFAGNAPAGGLPNFTKKKAIPLPMPGGSSQASKVTSTALVSAKPLPPTGPSDRLAGLRAVKDALQNQSSSPVSPKPIPQAQRLSLSLSTSNLQSKEGQRSAIPSSASGSISVSASASNLNHNANSNSAAAALPSPTSATTANRHQRTSSFSMNNKANAGSANQQDLTADLMSFAVVAPKGPSQTQAQAGGGGSSAAPPPPRRTSSVASSEHLTLAPPPPSLPLPPPHREREREYDRTRARDAGYATRDTGRGRDYDARERDRLERERVAVEREREREREWERERERRRSSYGYNR